MGLLMNSRALKIISSEQITLNNIYDGYTVNLSNDNFDIICNDNGDALAGEIGSVVELLLLQLYLKEQLP